jgi:hypothetical protein
LLAVFRAYFLWNFSTRPAVSTSFCRPVKNGWHLEQIAMRRFGTVERVGYVAPHAHTIEVSTYLGWISAFIHFSRGMAAEIFGFKIAQAAPSDNQYARLTVHGRQKLGVTLRLFDLINQQLHAVNGVEGIEHLAQDPDTVKFIIIQ